MTQVFFYSSTGPAVLADPVLNSLCQWHVWQNGGAWAYGCCIPNVGVHPGVIVDRLNALGVQPYSSLHDTTQPLAIATPSTTAMLTNLSSFGVTSTDTTAQIAQKMYTASGHPMLRPNMF